MGAAAGGSKAGQLPNTRQLQSSTLLAAAHPPASMELGHTRPSKPSSWDRKRRSTPKGLPARAPAWRRAGRLLEHPCMGGHECQHYVVNCRPRGTSHAVACRLRHASVKTRKISPVPEPRGSVPTRGIKSRSRMSSRCHEAAWLSSQWPHRTVCGAGASGNETVSGTRWQKRECTALVALVWAPTLCAPVLAAGG